MAELTFFFTSSKAIEQDAKEIPNPKIGCTTAGEIDRGLKKGLVTFKLDTKDFNYHIIKVTNTAIPVLKAKEIQEAIPQVMQNKKNLICFVLNDGLSGHEEVMQTTLKSILPEGTPIIGGSAGDDLNFANTYCCIDQDVFTGAVILLLGTNLRYAIHKENIYAPTNKSVIVTEADDRTVFKLDNVKASKRYAELLGVPESQIEKYFFENPLGKVNGDEIYISSPQKVNKDGSITFYCKMLPSSFLKLLAPTDIQTQLEITVNKVLKMGQPIMTLTSNCILRKLKFENDHIEPLVNSYLKRLNAVGFTTYGEQLNGLHINQTMVTLSFYKEA